LVARRERDAAAPFWALKRVVNICCVFIEMSVNKLMTKDNLRLKLISFKIEGISTLL